MGRLSIEKNTRILSEREENGFLCTPVLYNILFSCTLYNRSPVCITIKVKNVIFMRLNMWLCIRPSQKCLWIWNVHTIIFACTHTHTIAHSHEHLYIFMFVRITSHSTFINVFKLTFKRNILLVGREHHMHIWMLRICWYVCAWGKKSPS